MQLHVLEKVSGKKNPTKGHKNEMKKKETLAQKGKETAQTVVEGGRRRKKRVNSQQL